jgi:hypothetical protein
MTTGSYESPTEAEQALKRVAKRNEQLDAEYAHMDWRTAVATDPDAKHRASS